MENVLSKKVKRFWAFALAFVLTLTSLPLSAQSVLAADPKPTNFKLTVKSSADDKTVVNNGNEGSLNLIQGGSAEFKITDVASADGSAFDVSSAGVKFDWSSAEGQDVFSYNGNTDEASAVVRGIKVGTGSAKITAGSAEIGSGSAIVNVNVYGLFRNGENVIDNASAVEIVSGSNENPELKYYFGSKADEKNQNSMMTWEIVPTTAGVTVSNETGKEGTVSFASNAKAGSVTLRATDKGSFLHGGKSSAETRLTIVDLSSAPAVQDVDGKIVYKSSAIAEDAGSITIPENGSATVRINIGASKEKGNTITGETDSTDASGITVTPLRTPDTSSADGYRDFVLKAGELESTATAPDPTVVTFSSKVKLGEKEIEIGKAILKVYTRKAPAYSFTRTKSAKNGIMDKYDEDGVAYEFKASDNQNVLNYASAETRSAINKESTGLYLLKGSLAYKAFDEEGSAASKLSMSYSEGSAEATLRVNDTSSAEGVYTLVSTADVLDVVESGSSGATGKYAGETYEKESTYSEKFAVISMDGEGITVSSAGTAGKYTAAIPLNSSSEESETEKTIKIVGLSGLIEDTENENIKISWAAKPEGYFDFTESSDGTSVTITNPKVTLSTGVDLTATITRSGYTAVKETINVTVSDVLKDVVLYDAEKGTKLPSSGIKISKGASKDVWVKVDSSSADYIKYKFADDSSETPRTTSTLMTVSNASAGTAGWFRFTITGKTGEDLEGEESVIFYYDNKGDNYEGQGALTVQLSEDTITLTGGDVYLPVNGTSSKTVTAQSEDSSEIVWTLSSTPAELTSKIESTADRNGVRITASSAGVVGKGTVGVKVKGASQATTNAKVSVFGIQGNKDWDTEKDIDISSAINGRYDTTLYYVDDNNKDTMGLFFMAGTNTAEDSVNKDVVWTSSNEDVAIVDASSPDSPKVIPVGGGKAVIYGTYDKRSELGANAYVRLAVGVEVVDCGFELDSISDFFVRQGTGNYVVTPVITGDADKDEEYQLTDHVEYTFSITSSPTDVATGNKAKLSDGISSGNIITASSAIIQAGSASESGESYRVNVSAKFKNGVLKRITDSEIASTEFSFKVIDGAIVIDPKSVTTFAWRSTTGPKTINVERGEGTDSELPLAFGTDVARTENNAAVKITGNTITVTPVAGVNESFKLYVGDASDGEITAGNAKATYNINILGITNPDYGEAADYSFNLYIKGSTKKSATVNLLTTGGTTQALVEAASATGGYLKANDSFITWKSSDESIVKAVGGTGANAPGATLTPVAPGNATVTAKITIWNNANGSKGSDTKGKDASEIDSLEIPIAVTVSDLSDAVLADMDDVILEAGDVDASDAITITPSVSGNVEGIMYEYKLSDSEKNIAFVEAGSATVSEKKKIDGTDDPIGVVVKTGASITKTVTSSVTVTAYVRDGAGARTDIGNKKVTVTIVATNSDKPIKLAGGAKTALNYIIAATNLAASDSSGTAKTTNVTLGDLTAAGSGIYAFESGWDWKDPDTKVASLGAGGTIAYVPIVYTYTSGTTTYSWDSELSVRLVTIDGLEAAANLGTEATAVEPGEAITVNTSGTNVTITSLTFTSEDAGNLETFLERYVNTFTALKKGKSLVKLDVAGSSVTVDNEKVADAANTTNNVKTGYGFTITVSKESFTKSTVKATALGFTAAITVNNVKTLSEMKDPVIAGTGVAKKDNTTYYVEWPAASKSGDTLALTIDAYASNVESVSFASNNSSVIKVDKSSETTSSTNTFRGAITVSGPGYAEITVTAPDSVKSKSTVKLYVTSAAAAITAMEIDPAAEYTGAVTDATVVDAMMTGCGYNVTSLRYKSAVDAKGNAVTYFDSGLGEGEIASTGKNDLGSGKYYYLKLKEKDKPVAGTYTLTFDVTAKNAFSDAPVTIEATAKVVVAEIKFTANSFKVKQDGKPNFFYAYDADEADTYASLIFDCKDAVVGKVSLSSSLFRIVNVDGLANYRYTNNENYIVNPTGGKVYIALKESVKTEDAIKEAIKGKNAKLSFTVSPAGYDSKTFTKEVSLKAVYKAPKINLSVKSATIYSSLKKDKVTEAGLSQDFETRISVVDEITNLSWLDDDDNVVNNYDYGLIQVVNKANVNLVTDDEKNTPFKIQNNGYGWVTITANNVKKGTYKAFITINPKDQTQWQAYNDGSSTNFVGVKVPVTIKVDDRTKITLDADNKTIQLNSGSNFLLKEAALVQVFAKGGTALNAAASQKLVIAGANSKSQAVLSNLEIYRGYYNDGFNAVAKEGDKFADGDLVDVYRIRMKSAVAKGTYKFKISNTALTNSKPVTITLKVESAAPSVTLKKKGAIDVMDDESYILVTPSFKGISYEYVDNVDFDGTNKDMFGVDWDGDLKGYKVTTKNDYKGKYATNQTYSINIKFTLALNNGTNTTVTAAKPITFKVKNGKMTAISNPTTPTVSVGSKRTVTLTAYHKVKKAENAFINNTTNNGAHLIDGWKAKIVQLNNKDKVFIDVDNATLYQKKNGTNVNDKNFAVVDVTPLNVKPGKTVSVKVAVYEYGQASNVKPATVTIKVKVPKN